MRGRIALDQGSQALFRDLLQYPVKEQFLFALVRFREEFGAGGLQRFLADPAGTMTPEVIAGLRAMGLRESAAVVQRSVALLGPQFPREVAERRTAVSANAGALGELDGELKALLAVEERGLDFAMDRLARSR